MLSRNLTFFACRRLRMPSTSVAAKAMWSSRPVSSYFLSGPQLAARKLSQSQAAIDSKNLARQPLRGGARKLDNPFRDVVGNAAPTERNPCALVFLDGFCLFRR